MSDFITLQCPNCGGKLSVGNNVLSMKCENCGTEHMVRREAGGISLEYYARCPVCNRNDKVEKVTAILRSQPNPNQGVDDNNNISRLAVCLSPPSEPKKNIPQVYSPAAATFFAVISAMIGGFFLLFTCYSINIALSDVSKLNSTDLLCSSFTLFFFGLSGWLFFSVRPRQYKKFEEEKLANVPNQKKYLIEFKIQMNQWKLAMDRWNRLYYCSRDDCVFLPTSATYAPVTDMIEYLNRPMERK